jgi:hypothetical protein
VQRRRLPADVRTLTPLTRRPLPLSFSHSTPPPPQPARPFPPFRPFAPLPVPHDPTPLLKNPETKTPHTCLSRPHGGYSLRMTLHHCSHAADAAHATPLPLPQPPHPYPLRRGRSHSGAPSDITFVLFFQYRTPPSYHPPSPSFATGLFSASVSSPVSVFRPFLFFARFSFFRFSRQARNASFTCRPFSSIPTLPLSSLSPLAAVPAG